MNRPFRVNIAALRHAPGSALRITLSGPVPALAMPEAAVVAGATASVTGRLEWASGGLLATLEVSAPWVGECRRCLQSASGTLHAVTRELFSEDAAAVEEGLAYPLRGDVVELLPLVRDALLLELPIAPLCKQDCEGLCPQCGGDRNLERCGCRAEVLDPRWAALGPLVGG